MMCLLQYYTIQLNWNNYKMVFVTLISAILIGRERSKTCCHFSMNAEKFATIPRAFIPCDVTIIWCNSPVLTVTSYVLFAKEDVTYLITSYLRFSQGNTFLSLTKYLPSPERLHFNNYRVLKLVRSERLANGGHFERRLIC